jgi:hypothetical protein
MVRSDLETHKGVPWRAAPRQQFHPLVSTVGMVFELALQKRIMRAKKERQVRVRCEWWRQWDPTLASVRHGLVGGQVPLHKLENNRVLLGSSNLVLPERGDGFCVNGWLLWFVHIVSEPEMVLQNI